MNIVLKKKSEFRPKFGTSEFRAKNYQIDFYFQNSCWVWLSSAKVRAMISGSSSSSAFMTWIVMDTFPMENCSRYLYHRTHATTEMSFFLWFCVFTQLYMQEFLTIFSLLTDFGYILSFHEFFRFLKILRYWYILKRILIF